MDRCMRFFFVCFIVPLYVLHAEADRGGKAKLFVFGDSYADTGNSPVSASQAWKSPYGMTFPGKPSGRFSDGRVLTDYVAKFLGIRSPIPYQLTKNSYIDPETLLLHGVNFAHGGTGVFDTLVDEPNMTAQIDFLQQLVEKNEYTREDLSSYIALISLAGNDYSTYLAKKDSMEGLPAFARSVINQLMLNVQRVNDLGIKKIAITGIEPLGCLPRNSAVNNYEKCDEGENSFSQTHNQLLMQNIQRLNRKAGSQTFFYLDLYNAFLSALEFKQDNPKGNLTEKLRPCCVGTHGEDCGLINKNGEKRFLVCENINKSFFWDYIHPSEAGWRAVYSCLKSSLYFILL